MANIQSRHISEEMPIPSHGYGANTKCARYQVTMPATANADTIEFGYLPDYAVPVEVVAHCTAAHANIDIGVTGDEDGFFDGAALVANVPLRTALSTLIGKNSGLGKVKVTGLSNGVGAAGILNLMVFYVVEDQGVAYPYVAMVP